MFQVHLLDALSPRAQRGTPDLKRFARCVGIFPPPPRPLSTASHLQECVSRPANQPTNYVLCPFPPPPYPISAVGAGRFPLEFNTGLLLPPACCPLILNFPNVPPEPGPGAEGLKLPCTKRFCLASALRSTKFVIELSRTLETSSASSPSSSSSSLSAMKIWTSNCREVQTEPISKRPRK